MALIALSIIIFGPSLAGRSSDEEVARQAANEKMSETTADCSGASATDHACYQKRYESLVRDSGVQAAFAELKDEFTEDEFVNSNCHHLTHVIGRAALDLHGDLSSAYSRGDNFCWSGYYHGAMEAVVAQIGPDKIVEQADTICDGLGEQGSFYNYNCVHGLGHGFMGIQQNELFESLETCDTLKDTYDSESCYSGVFMENVMAAFNPSSSTKYLKADQPLYPCTDVEAKYKEECYKMQTSYALTVQDNGFAGVFDLCKGVDDEYRTTCYQSLGRDASGQTVSDVDNTRDICMQGEDDEARSNCIQGAVMDFISYYSDDTQAKELCEALDTDLRDECLRTAKDFYTIFET